MDSWYHHEIKVWFQPGAPNSIPLLVMHKMEAK